MTLFSSIAALTNNRVIGKNNQLIWHLPNDLKHFKEITIDKTIIMGRSTYQSIGKALPRRNNIVLSRNKNFFAPDATIIHDLDKLIEYCSSLAEKEVFIIGGEEIYRLTMSLVKKMYITLIHSDLEGDAFFPSWQENEWRIISRVNNKKDERHLYDYDFIELEKL